VHGQEASAAASRFNAARDDGGVGRIQPDGAGLCLLPDVRDAAGPVGKQQGWRFRSGPADLERTANDIRASKIWQIGNGNLNSFTGIPLGANQQGNALKLSMTTDTNKYYIYYFDTNACALYRGHSGSTSRTCVASYLTNTMYFQAQDYHGSNQTDLTHKGVINVKMQFCQYQYPITKIGPGYYYDYYKMEMRVTPHAPDGP
jgi:hypothetical protein